MKFKIAMMFGGLWLSLQPLFAVETIEIPEEKIHNHYFDKNYKIAGAYGANNLFFTVNNSDSKIYQLPFDGSFGPTTSKLVEYKDLSKLIGNYNAGKTSGSNYHLEGVTYCKAPKGGAGGLIFYVVNGKTGDILKVLGNQIQKLDISYDNFANFKYEVGNDGFMGVASDCTNNKLFVAKQRNPNIVFAIDLNQNAVTNAYDLSTGSDSEDDISDLFFLNNELYVLQKNITLIQVIDPSKKRSEMFLRRYDYSVTSQVTKSDGDHGIVEGLVVQQINNAKSIYLFLSSGGASSDKNVFVELKI